MNSQSKMSWLYCLYISLQDTQPWQIYYVLFHPKIFLGFLVWSLWTQAMSQDMNLLYL